MLAPVPRSSTLLLAVAASMIGAAAACVMPPDAPHILPAPEVADEGLAPAQVALPPVPPLTILDVPRTYPNGAYSISGLMLAREALRDEPVKVMGIIASIYECQERRERIEALATLAEVNGGEPVANGVSDAGCLMPHFYIVDSVRSPQRLLITDYDPSIWEHQLKVGNRYLFEGTYAQRAPGFTSTEDGLLTLESIEGSGIHSSDELIAE